jgi:hypothetical protein
MPHKTPWDGREPITDAMERFAVRDAFQRAIDANNSEEAVRLLCLVGANAETAWAMITILIPAEEGDS